VLFGLLLWLPFTDSVIATVLALAWYGLAGGALHGTSLGKTTVRRLFTGVIAYRNFEVSSR
jgi:VIT1/CCC1 family predicted Fe2+/Mn2+ transporter